MRRGLLILVLFCIVCCFGVSEARKVKNNFKIEKSSSKSTGKSAEMPEGREVSLTDTINFRGASPEEIAELKKCVFSGYDKELSSRIESFILTNNSSQEITGFELRIDYLDMQGRMLHSREVWEKCLVPAGESRRIDIKSWDNHNTYYYHLGNEPRRVATPFRVTFTPKKFWVKF